MPAVAITGKQVTFTFGALDGSAQVTTATVDESASSETIQTLAGSVAIAQGVEATISADFLYDGQASGGFYAALKAALDSGSTGVLTINAGGTSEWSGDAIVTALSAEMPADGAVTCSAELTVSGQLGWTDAATPLAAEAGAEQEESVA